MIVSDLIDRIWYKGIIGFEVEETDRSYLAKEELEEITNNVFMEKNKQPHSVSTLSTGLLDVNI